MGRESVRFLNQEDQHPDFIRSHTRLIEKVRMFMHCSGSLCGDAKAVALGFMVLIKLLLCTCTCTYNHTRALKGLIRGFTVVIGE